MSQRETCLGNWELRAFTEECGWVGYSRLRLVLYEVGTIISVCISSIEVGTLSLLLRAERTLSFVLRELSTRISLFAMWTLTAIYSSIIFYFNNHHCSESIRGRCSVHKNSYIQKKLTRRGGYHMILIGL